MAEQKRHDCAAELRLPSSARSHWALVLSSLSLHLQIPVGDKSPSYSPAGITDSKLRVRSASFAGASWSTRTGKRVMPPDQREVSKVRSVHDQVSRERLREEHWGVFRRLISARNSVKNSVKLCAERAPETSPDSDLSDRKQTCSRPYTCPVNRRVVGSSPTSGAIKSTT